MSISRLFTDTNWRANRPKIWFLQCRHILFLLGLLIMVGASSCTSSGEPCEFPSSLSLEAQETSLEEASNFIGKTIPPPTYLPKGYKIQKVFIEPFYERPLGSRLTLLISDKKIKMEITTYTDHAGRTDQRYEFKCKMEMHMWYSPAGHFGCKLPHCERLKVGKGSGCLEDRGTHYVLWWPCSSSPLEFAMVLSVSKRIPKEELIKVAESTSDIRE